MNFEDRPSVDERYARAIESSHLEVLPTRCSVDYLIAAGWIRDGLGASLYRLRTEFDAVRGEQRLAAGNARAARDEVRRLKHIATGADESTAESTLANAARIAEDAERQALTDRVLILTQLKSLNGTKEALHRYAVAFATRQRFMQPDPVVHLITSRAMELWLDPLCPHCQGRRFNGGFNAPLVWCVECSATGDRGKGPKGMRLHHSYMGQQFGRALLSEMDRKADSVNAALKRYLSNLLRDDAGWGPAKALAIRKELAGLSSAQAQED